VLLLVKRATPKDNDYLVKFISDNPEQKDIILQRNMVLKLLRVVYIGKAVYFFYFCLTNDAYFSMRTLY
jgi:hypothetical protein